MLLPPALSPVVAGEAVPRKVPHPATHPAGAVDGHCSAELGCALWDIVFGRFPRLSWVPPVQVGIYSHALAAADFSPAALRVEHPMLRRLAWRAGEAQVQPPYGECVSYDVARGIPQPHCAAAGSRLQLLSCAPGGGAPTPWLVEHLADGWELFYPLSGGYPQFLRTAENSLLSAEQFAEQCCILRAADGSLCQVRSATAGLLHVRVLTPHAYIISLFAPQQVGALGDDGLYACCGAPYRSFGLTGVPGSAMDLLVCTPGAESLCYHWRRHSEVLWSFRRGDAPQAPTLTLRKTVLRPGVWVEERSLTTPCGHEIAYSAVQYRCAPFGQVVEQRVRGRGAAAQCTRYFYGEQPTRADYGRLVRKQLPGGSCEWYCYE